MIEGSGMITCREFIEFLMAYLSEELPESQRSRFEAHLAGCKSCVAYMDSYLKTVDLEKAALADPESGAPEDAPEDLIKAILSAKKKRE